MENINPQNTTFNPQNQMDNQNTSGFMPSLSHSGDRINKKPFGIFITPKTSPVQPERFYGYHTGADFEIFPEELNLDVPVHAVCSGKILLREYIGGYGGVAIQSCTLDNQPITVLYGHLKLASITSNVGDNITVGETLGILGANTNPVGQSIRVSNNDFQIVGIAAAKGGSGPMSQDDYIYVPITSAQHYLAGDNFVNNISITANDQSAMASIQEEIGNLLLKRHNISDAASADFSLMNQNDIIETASSITGTFTMLLASIAGISLLVGGIGIMNMMLMIVTERTREIGLRKAVGTRKIYINLQFLAEAIFLTFLGGAIGILLGWGASLLITKFVSSLTTEISLSSVILAFGVSAAVGIVFGFYPARRAANLSPIEALRYE